MDILNWLYLKKQQLIRTTASNTSTDLVAIGGEVPFTTRGDGYKTYAMTMHDFGLYARPYKNYMALITQSDNDPPVATVLENTLDVNVEFEYDATGLYYAVFNQALFASENSYVTVSGNTASVGGDTTVIQAVPVFFYVIEIKSTVNGSNSDDIVGQITPCVFEIRVYN